MPSFAGETLISFRLCLHDLCTDQQEKDYYYDKQEKLPQIEEGLLVPVAEEKKR